MENDLVALVRELRLEGVAIVDDVAAISAIDDFARLYVADRNLDFWWEDLTVPTTGVSIQNRDTLLAEIERTAAGWGLCTMIVTDENSEPSAVFTGTAPALIEVCRQTWIFEFVLATSNLDRFVFSTHMSTLLWFPNPAEKLEARFPA